MIVSAQVTLRRYEAIFDNWRAPLDFLANLLNPNISQAIVDTVARLVRGVGPRQLRVMPLGDSITYGVASLDGSGYLARFRDWALGSQRPPGLLGKPRIVLVGSQRSGPAALANEGHSGWTIGDVAGIADSALVT